MKPSLLHASASLETFILDTISRRQLGSNRSRGVSDVIWIGTDVGIQDPGPVGFNSCTAALTSSRSSPGILRRNPS